MAERGRTEENFADCAKWLGFSGAVADYDIHSCGSYSTHADFWPIPVIASDLRGNLPDD